MSAQYDDDTQSESSEPSDNDGGIGPMKPGAPQRSRPIGHISLRRSPSPDEFEAYDLSEFSMEDFAELDRIVSGMSKLSIPDKGSKVIGHGGPALEIGLEYAEENSNRRRPENLQAIRDKSSPYEVFRSSTGVLGVTDITGPAWCELKFDYGLRKKRCLSSDGSATSFTTAAGNVVTIDQRIAHARNKAVTRGKLVHKIAEGKPQSVHEFDEGKVHSETEWVDTLPKHERWGLRLFKMIFSLLTLIANKKCEEMQVFGLIHDQIVVGQIDEVVCRSSTDSQRSEEKAKAKASHNSAQSAASDHQYTLHLVDLKTRVRDTLPPEEDALGSRVQLMLYHRLLSNALSSYKRTIPSLEPLDFDALWRKAEVDPTRVFSPSFLRRSHFSEMQVDAEEAYSCRCLDQLVEIWHRTVGSFNIIGVNKTLTLLYRSQSCTRRHASNQDNRRCTSRPDTGTSRSSSAPSVSNWYARDSHTTVPASISDTGAIRSKQAEYDPLLASSEPSGHAATKWPVHAPGTAQPHSSLSSVEENKIIAATDLNRSFKMIGTTTFSLDDNFLDDYVQHVLAWWYGERVARGVTAPLRRRCWSCEYSLGCEWRK